MKATGGNWSLIEGLSCLAIDLKNHFGREISNFARRKVVPVDLFVKNNKRKKYVLTTIKVDLKIKSLKHTQILLNSYFTWRKTIFFFNDLVS